MAGAALDIQTSLTGRRWLWRRGEDRVGLGIAQRLALPELIGRLLSARGIGMDDAAHFLDPTLRALLPDPSVLADMDAAAARLAAAVQRSETVAVFGDYDVDGACSAAIITTVLRTLGCTVMTHVPDRLLEGYGPNGPALLSLADQGATLVVCVDCGTAAPVALAAVQGRADVVVLDHHVPEGPPPPVLATVNPNRADCSSGLGGVCAAAVAFLAAVATLRVLRRAGWFAGRAEPDLLDLLDLVALATVCDVMPLTGLNRALVVQGLRVMARRARPGIRALLDAAAARDVPTAFTCGFALGPRINAAGRISTSDLGLRLLLCEDPVEARALAETLDSTNRSRQQVEAAMLDAALAQAAAQSGAGHATLVVHGEGWHPGVVGIVASRLKDRVHRPTFVFARGQDGLLKGSGRSIAGFHLRDALDLLSKRHPEVLVRFGGHAMAAGCTLAEADFATFDAAFQRVASEWLDAATLSRTLLADGPLGIEHFNAPTVRALDAQVWGQAFEAPVFVDEVEVVSQRLVGEKHLKLALRFAGEARGSALRDAIWFGHSEPVGAKVRLAYRLSVDEYNGRERVQMIVEAVG